MADNPKGESSTSGMPDRGHGPPGQARSARKTDPALEGRAFGSRPRPPELARGGSARDNESTMVGFAAMGSERPSELQDGRVRLSARVSGSSTSRRRP